MILQGNHLFHSMTYLSSPRHSHRLVLLVSFLETEWIVFAIVEHTHIHTHRHTENQNLMSLAVGNDCIIRCKWYYNSQK